ncbi:MAG: acetyltransferase [Polyangiaceae bacterium]
MTGAPARTRCVIWGASGHGLVVADAAAGDFEVVGFIDDDPRVRERCPSSLNVLGGRELLADLYAQGVRFAHAAIGGCATRLLISELLLKCGFQLCTIVHPRAIVAASAQLGPGSLVAAGAIVCPDAKIGASTIVNTGASVDHECVIEDGVHIGPGVRIGGNTRVGRGAWIGIGATVLNNLTIGEGSVIGGGAVVVKDIPPRVVVYGVPAVVRRRA